MAVRSLNVSAFYSALDSKRAAGDMSWREVAREAGVASSIFTRLSKGHRPDVDTFMTLVLWLGVSAERFVDGPGPTELDESTMDVIARYLRADRALRPKSAQSIDAIIRSLYDTLADDPEDES